MCGIAGYLSRGEPAQEAIVRAMCGSIRHRGPDDEGVYLDGRCGIGMRRLSIIDLSTGHQPLSNEDGSVWVVFNGEIYNYPEIRSRLESLGHTFSTHSDTEVLVHLYEQDGLDGVQRLRGMYAYAIWDQRKKSLFLARDRLGKKPLYVATFPQGIYFASEIKCFLAVGLPLEPDNEALQLYLQFGYVPDPWSAYRNVRKLPPASWMQIDSSGQIRSGSYWQVPPPTASGPSSFREDEAIQQLRELFDDSVRCRLMADVPLGAFLSGGIDSSLVVASMALQTGKPVQTFSIGWEEASHNELPWARQIAERYETDHHEIIVRPDAVSLIQKLAGYFDEPFADSSAIPTFLVSEFASRTVKVALSGDGGDEFFGGYPSFQQAERLTAWDSLPGFARSLLSLTGDLLPYQFYGKNYLRCISRPSALERYFEQTTFSTHYMRQHLLQPQWLLPFDAQFLRKTFDGAILPDSAGAVSQAMHFEATAKLAGDILVKVDRMSMATGLEVRSPLLDHRLVEFASTLPHHWKIHGGKGKQILRKAFGDRLPENFFTRPKQGFGIPMEAWFRGPLRDFLYDHLESSAFAGRDILRPGKIRLLLTEHLQGRRDNSVFLWLLLMLEMWFRGHTRGTPLVSQGTLS